MLTLINSVTVVVVVLLFSGVGGGGGSSGSNIASSSGSGSGSGSGGGHCNGNCGRGSDSGGSGSGSSIIFCIVIFIILSSGGDPPCDRQRTRNKMVTMSRTVFIFMCSMASLGICLAIAFLCFNVRSRTRRYLPKVYTL